MITRFSRRHCKVQIFFLTVVAFLLVFLTSQNVQAQRAKVRISNASLSYTALPLVAAKNWGIFADNGLDVEIIVMRSSIAAPALVRGDIDFVAGVGPASVSATLSGIPSRAIWFSADRTVYWLMSQPQYKKLEDLKSRKIGLSGLGGTTHVTLLMALEKLGVNPKDFVIVSLRGQNVLQVLESGFVAAASLNPPLNFSAEKDGFNKLVDIGSMVQMPSGGLTSLVNTIQERPAQVKRVLRSLQLAKDEIRRNKNKTVELIVRALNMDKAVAAQTYDLYLTTLNPTGIPSREGMENIVKALHSLGRFADRKVAFTDIADDSLAREVAKEMGYKIN
jgi:NitT/TauT family transport system substrate-binding protein